MFYADSPKMVFSDPSVAIILLTFFFNFPFYGTEWCDENASKCKPNPGYCQEERLLAVKQMTQNAEEKIKVEILKFIFSYGPPHPLLPLPSPQKIVIAS